MDRKGDQINEDTFPVHAEKDNIRYIDIHAFCKI